MIQKLKLIHLAGLAAILAPVAYLAGRFANNFLGTASNSYLAAGLSAIAFGALLGIPVGLFFGSIKAQPTIVHEHPDMRSQQDKILHQIRAELSQNQALFKARKGDSTVLARISYLTGFWSSAKASGQLFVMQEPKLLATISTAYYWIDQANHLENLAYEAKYTSTVVIDNQNASTHLIAEARLLDGPLDSALTAAIVAIDQQLATDTVTPAPSIQG